MNRYSILGDSSFDTDGFLGILTFLTPLRIAALSDNVDLCRFLVEAGADVFAKCDESRASMMHYAALNATNGLELIDFFGFLGLKANVKDRFGEEPIHYAIRAKNIEIAKALLRRRQENAGRNNLLHFCVIENNLRLAQIVLECEEEMLDQYGESGKNTIHLAARHADLQMCKWLVGKGANLQALSKDEYEDSVLHSAALNKTHGSQLVPYFVSELAFDVNAKDKLLLTPLHYALQNEFIDVAEVLVTLGADLDPLPAERLQYRNEGYIVDNNVPDFDYIKILAIYQTSCNINIIFIFIVGQVVKQSQLFGLLEINVSAVEDNMLYVWSMLLGCVNDL
ncbi:putative ankyrin repeat protein RF_0381 [Cloeon dipterum]|uniref:putative ankyrin repeat protein RF_0381 n=1 Tax=Cloeon dipterum TaxID=197152 RepID=UPI0032201CA2